MPRMAIATSNSTSEKAGRCACWHEERKCAPSDLGRGSRWHSALGQQTADMIGSPCLASEAKRPAGEENGNRERAAQHARGRFGDRREGTSGGLRQLRYESIDIIKVLVPVSIDVAVQSRRNAERTEVSARVTQCQYEVIDVVEIDIVVAIHITQDDGDDINVERFVEDTERRIAHGQPFDTRKAAVDSAHRGDYRKRLANRRGESARQRQDE